MPKEWFAIYHQQKRFLDLWCYSPRGSPKCDIIYYDLLLGIIFLISDEGTSGEGPCSHKRKPQMIAYIYTIHTDPSWVMYISLESIQLINGTFFSPTRNFFHQKLGEKPNPNHGPFPFLCPTRDDLIAPKCLMIEYMVVDISHINLRSSTSGNAFHKNPRETKV